MHLFSPRTVSLLQMKKVETLYNNSNAPEQNQVIGKLQRVFVSGDWNRYKWEKSSMEIPFDNNSGEQYNLEIVVSEIESGDGVILTLNKKACESFAKLFQSLANETGLEHIHLGYSESEPQGPGFRIVVID